MIDFEERRDELLEEIEEMTRRKQYKALRDILVELEPADIADLFDDLPEEMLPLLFRLLPKEPAAELFVELEPDVQEMLIRGFSNTELKEVLDELYLDDAVDIVEEMPAGVVKRILKHADPDTRKSINEILKYPEDSAGALMTTEFVDLKRDMTVEDAFKRIRRTGTDKETINVCYVVDPARKLLGIVSLRTILLSDEDDIIEDIMETHVISVGTLEDKEDVAQTFSKYDFIALPVVDKEDRLVGIITVDDAMDVMEAEATEDIEKMAAMLPTDKPYLKTSVFETFKSRIPWLLLLMVSATFTGQIIAKFEDALGACAILTAYIPMLMDTGGNCGSQASVTVIRGISLDEIEFSDLLRVIWKEIRVAVLCAAVLSAANFVKLLLVDKMIFGNPITMTVAAVICLTLIAVLFVVSMFIISNTIKLTTFDRRDEIAIMKMVGATDGFIRWPFVYEGLLLGLIGAAVGFSLQWLLYAAVTRGIANSDTMQLLRVVDFRQIWAPVAAVFAGVGILVGVGGSLTAIRKFLRV